MVQGAPFRFIRDAALTARQGAPFRFIRDAALTARQGAPFRFLKGVPVVTGVRAKQVVVDFFDATVEGRALFSGGVFNLVTSDTIFDTAAVSTSKLIDIFLKADGTLAMTGDLQLSSNKITGLSSGTVSTDIVTKGQLDAAIGGLVWKDPVAVKNIIGSSTISGINGLSPTLGDAYILTDAGTPTAGTSDVLVIGSLTEFNGTSWKEIVAGVGGFPPNETRALASTTTALNGTIGLTDNVDDGKLLQWDGTSLTPSTEISPDDGNAVLVSGDEGVFEGLVFSYDGIVPTGSWVQFTGISSSTAGAGLIASGNAYNVGDINRGTQVNTDDLEIDASEIAASSGGLKAGGNSWQLTIEPADFAGTGLEDDGSDNLRLAAQGNGIAGGVGSILSIQPDTTGGAGSGTVSSNDIAQVTVNANGVGIDVTRLDGDHLDITFTPSNYTPDVGVPEADDVDDLSAHLNGIDAAIAGLGGISRQEIITSQIITGTDVVLSDTINNVPKNNEAVKLFLNGVFQSQGAGLDYTVSGTSITWLAGSGTSVDMDLTDILIIVYDS